MPTLVRAHWFAMVVAVTILFSGTLSTARAAEPSIGVVVALYRDFASDAVLDEPAQQSLWGQTARVWAKYFSNELVALHSRVVECETRSKGICGTEVSPIWFTQDPSGTTVTLRRASTETTVLAHLHYSGVPVASSEATIEYRLKLIEHRWKIVDVAYPDGTTLKGWMTAALK